MHDVDDVCDDVDDVDDVHVHDVEYVNDVRDVSLHSHCSGFGSEGKVVELRAAMGMDFQCAHNPI